MFNNYYMDKYKILVLWDSTHKNRIIRNNTSETKS